jgi:hypothetical protein
MEGQRDSSQARKCLVWSLDILESKLTARLGELGLLGVERDSQARRDPPRRG